MGPFRILAGNPALKRLMAGFALLNIGEWAYVTALTIEVFRRFGTLAVGVIGLRLFFAAVSSFLSTAMIQRRRPGRLLLEIAAVRAVLVAVTAGLVAARGPLAPLLLLLALDSVVSAMYRPAQAAILPGLSRSPRELGASAAGVSTVKTLSQAVGAVLGGVLLAVSPPGAVFSGTSVVFLLCGVAVLPFGSMGLGARRHGRPAGIVGLMRETAAVVRNPHVATLLVVSGLRTFVRGMWVGMAVIVSLRLLKAGSAGVGLLMLAGGIGSAIAAPLSAHMITRSRIGTPASAALAACGLPLAVLAGIPMFDVAIALITAWGIGMAVADVATSSMMNRVLDTPALPRVTSAIEAVKLALEGLGGFLAPVLITVLGIRGTLVVAAIPLPIVVLGGWRALHRLDASAGERAALLEMLHGVTCLEPLDMASLDGLIGRLTPMYAPNAGTEIVRQHEPGDRFYVIERGEADVLVDGFRVGRLRPGSGFGERALLRDGTRTATVRSVSPLQLLVLPRDDFLEALTGTADVSTVLAVPAHADGSGAWDYGARARMLSRLNLFSHLDIGELDCLARQSSLEQWSTGAAIIRQGESGDRYFVLLEGRASVVVDGTTVNHVCPGDQFGEIALLHEVPRSADVLASEPAVTMSLGREDFEGALRDRLLAG